MILIQLTLAAKSMTSFLEFKFGKSLSPNSLQVEPNRSHPPLSGPDSRLPRWTIVDLDISSSQVPSDAGLFSLLFQSPLAGGSGDFSFLWLQIGADRPTNFPPVIVPQYEASFYDDLFAFDCRPFDAIFSPPVSLLLCQFVWCFATHVSQSVIFFSDSAPSLSSNPFLMGKGLLLFPLLKR